MSSKANIVGIDMSKYKIVQKGVSLLLTLIQQGWG